MAVREARGGFHSRPLLAFVVACHLLGGVALSRVLAPTPRSALPPITVSLIAEAEPALEQPDVLPQPLPPAAEPPSARRELPTGKPPVQPPPPQPVEATDPPPVAERPPVPPEPQIQPEPAPPVRQSPAPPEPAPTALPPAPLARLEPDATQVPVLPEPPRPAQAPEPIVAKAAPPEQPLAVAPPPRPPEVRDPAPVTEPLYGADYLNNPKPVYPLLSRKLGEQGLVVLRVFVTAQGDPREVVLKEGSGYVRLDRAAQEIVQRWKFVPAKRGSQPVDAWVLVPIRFSLKG